MRQAARELVGAIVILVAFLAALVWAANIAYGAQPIETQDKIDIEIGTIRGDPFEMILVAEIQAEAGDSCAGQVQHRNNESTRSDTDLVFTSGGVEVAVILGVEAEGFGGGGLGFTANGPVEVHIRLGAEGLWSAGVDLEATCNTPQDTTTTTATATSTTTTQLGPTVTTTTPLATSTTLSEPPSGPVEAGGGSCAGGGCEPIWARVVAVIAAWALVTLLLVAAWRYFFPRGN